MDHWCSKWILVDGQLSESFLGVGRDKRFHIFKICLTAFSCCQVSTGSVQCPDNRAFILGYRLTPTGSTGKYRLSNWYISIRQVPSNVWLYTKLKLLLALNVSLFILCHFSNSVSLQKSFVLWIKYYPRSTFLLVSFIINNFNPKLLGLPFE